MSKEELKNNIIELKESCRKLAEEYREKYNHDNSNKIALNMFYHNVISYNDYESVLALIENRNSVIMAFSAPPILTEETIEVNLKRITELEKENAELKETCNKWFEHLKNREEELLNELNNQNAKYESQIEELEKENARLRHYHNCEECEAFSFCPQKPKREDYEDENRYLIDLECGVWSCKNTIKLLVEENTKLKKRNGELASQKASLGRWFGEAKKIIRKLLDFIYGLGNFRGGLFDKAEAFLKESE